MPQDPIQPGTLCINCSYDLAGLQESAVCPECGKPCTETVGHLDSINNKKEPLLQVYSGLRAVLIAHALVLATILVLILTIQFDNQDQTISTIGLIAGLIMIIVAAIYGLTGTAETTTFTTVHPTAKPKSFHRMMVQFSLAIGAVWFIVLIPTVLTSSEPLAFMVFAYSTTALVGILTYGSAGIMGETTLNRMSSNALRIASVCATALTTGTCIFYHRTLSDVSAKSFGLNGGTWQDLTILSIAALFLLHFTTTLVFWLSLRKHVRNLTPPTTPSTAP